MATVPPEEAPSRPPPLRVAWLGRVGYRRAAILQETLRQRVLEGTEAETLLLLEHPAVITLGRAALRQHVLVSDEALARSGVDLVRSTRGGDVTYHGPGQLVAYPVVRTERGVVAHVEAMAAAVIDLAREFGVDARYRPECPGVWVGDDKLCAFGVHIHHRVAIHGLGLNVTTPLGAFSTIIACGLREAGVTSLAAATGRADLSVAGLWSRLAEHLAVHLRRALVPLERTAWLSEGVEWPTQGAPDLLAAAEPAADLAPGARLAPPY